MAIYREFEPAEAPGLVFFLGQGFLEVSGRATTPAGSAVALWVQVRDVAAEHARLRAPWQEPWGLVEMWIADPDGVRLAFVQVLEGHPLRRDHRDRR